MGPWWDPPVEYAVYSKLYIKRHICTCLYLKFGYFCFITYIYYIIILNSFNSISYNMKYYTKHMYIAMLNIYFCLFLQGKYLICMLVYFLISLKEKGTEIFFFLLFSLPPCGVMRMTSEGWASERTAHGINAVFLHIENPFKIASLSISKGESWGFLGLSLGSVWIVCLER